MIQLFRHILLRLAATFWVLRATVAYEAGGRLYKETKNSKALLYNSQFEDKLSYYRIGETLRVPGG
jgi:hypothetical protein